MANRTIAVLLSNDLTFVFMDDSTLIFIDAVYYGLSLLCFLLWICGVYSLSGSGRSWISLYQASVGPPLWICRPMTPRCGSDASGSV